MFLSILIYIFVEKLQNKTTEGGKLLTRCYRSVTKLGGLLLWDLLSGCANHDQPVPNAAFTILGTQNIGVALQQMISSVNL